MITIKQIKNIAKDIKEDKEWVNDSHTSAEHKGVCSGLDRLVGHLQELETTKESNQINYTQTAIHVIFLLMLWFIFYVAMWIFY